MRLATLDHAGYYVVLAFGIGLLGIVLAVLWRRLRALDAPREQQLGDRWLVARTRPDCPFCHDALAPGDLGEGVVRCPACEVSHHTACWKEHEGCSTLGCRRDPRHRAALPVGEP